MMAIKIVVDLSIAPYYSNDLHTVKKIVAMGFVTAIAVRKAARLG